MTATNGGFGASSIVMDMLNICSLTRDLQGGAHYRLYLEIQPLQNAACCRYRGHRFKNLILRRDVLLERREPGG